MAHLFKEILCSHRMKKIPMNLHGMISRIYIIKYNKSNTRAYTMYSTFCVRKGKYSYKCMLSFAKRNTRATNKKLIKVWDKVKRMAVRHLWIYLSTEF